MFSRLRPATLALLVFAIIIQLGCASTIPRQHWWEFWRPKKVASSSADVQPLSYEIPGEAIAMNDDASFALSPSEPGAFIEHQELSPLDDESFRHQIDAPLPDPIRQSGAAQPTLETIRFGFDRYDLSPESKAALDRNLVWIRDHPGVQIQIEGHTDERGTLEYNLLLGERRAKAVKAYLVSRGVPEHMLGTISYGEERPIEVAQSEAAYALNRRAQFLAY